MQSKKTGGQATGAEIGPKDLVVAPAPGETGITAITEADIASYLEAMGNKLLPVHKQQFVALCRAYGLNPFLKEIYGVPYTDRDTGDTTFSVIVGYEVYLKRAERSGLLVHWEVKTEREDPVGTEAKGELKATITIERKDRPKPFVHEVFYSEYVQSKWDNQAKKYVPTKFWANKPRTMLKKVAIAQGFRLAFPIECGGMPYTAEEVADSYAVEYPDKAADTSDSPFRKGAGAPARFDGPAETAKFDEKPPFDPDPPKTNGNGLKSPGPGDPSKTSPASEAAPSPAPAAHSLPVSAPALEQAPAPAPAKTNSGDRLAFVVAQFEDNGTAFDRFLVSKKWIAAGDCLMDLSEAQVERIYNNIEVMDRAFNKFLEDERK